MRLGIVGGTFDPIHVGHLVIAEEARIKLSLEEVVFIPTGRPWMKQGRVLSEAHHRLSIVRLAVASNPFFRCSSAEVDRPGATYTVDTLEELHRESIGEDEIYFVLGADSAAQFHRWKNPGRILELCTLVVAPRPGFSAPDLGFLEEITPGASRHAILLEGPSLDISGTGIRRRISEGLAVRYQVPEGVERYLHSHGLYRDGGLPTD